MYMYMYMYICVCVCARTYVCVYVHVWTCVHELKPFQAAFCRIQLHLQYGGKKRCPAWCVVNPPAAG